MASRFRITGAGGVVSAGDQARELGVGNVGREGRLGGGRLNGGRLAGVRRVDAGLRDLVLERGQAGEVVAHAVALGLEVAQVLGRGVHRQLHPADDLDRRRRPLCRDGRPVVVGGSDADDVGAAAGVGVGFGKESAAADARTP